MALSQVSSPPIAPPVGAARPVPARWRTGGVSVPQYDRAALRPGVVHIGVGGFHRAHQLTYFDDLAQLGVDEWGVVGVGIRNHRLSRVLAAQDNLFTVVQRGRDSSSARVIGTLLEYLLLHDAPGTVVDRLSDPLIRMVTLTITGDGYDRPRRDATPPPVVFPVLAAALDRRRRGGIPPFTVLSCDNLPDNGAMARAALLASAEARSTRLADWVATSVAFPNSMVDRITPTTSAADRRRVAAEFGVTDGWPVITEPFSQWVIEDRFCSDRPPLDQVGARFVDDVAPYKLVKNRMLNGAHSALGYLGSLAGHRRTDEAMRDPVLGRFVDRLLAREVAPLLPSNLPGMALPAYQRTLLERFGNPAVGDTLARLCRRGSTKMPAYLLPSLREAQTAGRPRTLLLLAVAGWLRYLRGVADDGTTLEVQDARAAELSRLARDPDPSAVLRLTDIFGDLAEHREDVRQIKSMLTQFEQGGVVTTVRSFLCRP